MEKKFILDTLLPYKQDPTTCAKNEKGGCSYLTTDGRKCAVGKHLVDGEYQNSGLYAERLFTFYNPDDILTEEAKQQQIPINVWAKMQEYHDYIARGETFLVINDKVKELEQLTGFEFPELMFE